MLRGLLVQLAPLDHRVWLESEELQVRPVAVGLQVHLETWVQAERWEPLVILVPWVQLVLQEVLDRPA